MDLAQPESKFLLRISIAKRLMPKAVERNLLRRIAKEMFRNQVNGSPHPTLSSGIYLLHLDRAIMEPDTKNAVGSQKFTAMKRKRVYRESLNALLAGLR